MTSKKSLVGMLLIIVIIGLVLLNVLKPNLGSSMTVSHTFNVTSSIPTTQFTSAVGERSGATSIVIKQTITNRTIDPLSKGLFVVDDAILNNAPTPPFTELAADHFTIIGTIVYGIETTNQRKVLSAWLTTAESYGFKDFVILGHGNYSRVLNVTLPEALTLKPDFIIEDEPLSTQKWTQTQLQTFVKTAEQGNVGIIIDEFAPSIITNLYSTFGSDPRVLVAEDDYTHKSTILYNQQLAANYSKRAITWLFFCRLIMHLHQITIATRISPPG